MIPTLERIDTAGQRDGEQDRGRSEADGNVRTLSGQVIGVEGRGDGEREIGKSKPARREELKRECLTKIDFFCLRHIF